MKSRYEINENKRKKEKSIKKKSFLKKLLFILIGILLILGIWGKFIEPNLLTVKEYNIKNDNIPNSFNGVKIIQFSDLHYGIGNGEKKLTNIVNKINNLNPDVVVFTGDLIDKNYEISDNDLKTITKLLSKIESKLGKYACFGNHDSKNESFENIMYDSGFKLLKNNFDTIYNKVNTPIVIYGLDDSLEVNPSISALGGKEINDIPYKIVIMHEPDYIDEFIDNYDVNLVLAGHSHNGQVKLPGIRPIYLPKGAKTYYGNSYNINETMFYISNGVGNSIIDFRLFNTPSINLFRLTN